MHKSLEMFYLDQQDNLQLKKLTKKEKLTSAIINLKMKYEKKNKIPIKIYNTKKG